MPDDLEGSARGHQQQSERRLRECSRIFTRAGRYGLNIHGASVRHTLDFISHTMQKPFLPLPLSHSKGVADSKPMRYGVWGENDRQWEATYKAAYTRIATRIQALHFKNGMRRHETTKFKGIPRIIHHIWLGPPCPTSMRRWMRKWHDMHPRWQHILWDEKSIDGFGLRNAAAYDAAENFGEKSDIARYEILERMGGVYLDADMECLQRLDPLHRSENQCCFYAGMSNTGTVEVNNAVIGSCPHHPILKECIQRIHDSAKRRAETQAQHNQLAAIFAMSSQKSDNALDFSKVLKDKISAMFPTLEFSGPGLLTRVAMEALVAQEKQACASCTDGNFSESLGNLGDVWILPQSFFYPLPNTLRHEPLSKRSAHASPESIAMHHWACSWTDDGKDPRL